MAVEQALELPPQRREAAGLDLDERAAADEVDDVAVDRVLDQVARAPIPRLQKPRGADPRSASRSPARVFRRRGGRPCTARSRSQASNASKRAPCACATSRASSTVCGGRTPSASAPRSRSPIGTLDGARERGWLRTRISTSFAASDRQRNTANPKKLSQQPVQTRMPSRGPVSAEHSKPNWVSGTYRIRLVKVRSPWHSGPSFLPSRTMPTKRDVHQAGAMASSGLCGVGRGGPRVRT